MKTNIERSEFKNIKEAVQRNKLKDAGTNIDRMVKTLTKNNVSIRHKNHYE